MTAFIVGFWVGVGVCYGVTWLSTHPVDRAALFSRIKGMLNKDGEQ